MKLTNLVCAVVLVLGSTSAFAQSGGNGSGASPQTRDQPVGSGSAVVGSGSGGATPGSGAPVSAPGAAAVDPMPQGLTPLSVPPLSGSIGTSPTPGAAPPPLVAPLSASTTPTSAGDVLYTPGQLFQPAGASSSNVSSSTAAAFGTPASSLFGASLPLGTTSTFGRVPAGASAPLGSINAQPCPTPVATTSQNPPSTQGSGLGSAQGSGASTGSGIAASQFSSSGVPADRFERPGVSTEQLATMLPGARGTGCER